MSIQRVKAQNIDVELLADISSETKIVFFRVVYAMCFTEQTHAQFLIKLNISTYFRIFIFSIIYLPQKRL